MPPYVIAVIAYYFLCANTAIAAEVRYESEVLTIQAQNEPLKGVLLKITEHLGGKIIATNAALQERISFSGSGKPNTVLWKMLFNHSSYSINWSKDGKHIHEIRLLGKSDAAILPSLVSNNMQQDRQMDPVEPFETMISDEVPIEPEVIEEDLEAQTPPTSENTDDLIDPTLSDLPEENILIDEVLE